MDDKGYIDIGFAKIDSNRKARNGYPEVILGEGKDDMHASEIFARLSADNNTTIATRVSESMANAIISKTPTATYHKLPRLVINEKVATKGVGLVVVATGGTADIPVAEEASIVLEAYGSNVHRLYDVGVAGIHRLLDNKAVLDKANVIVAVAGMEGALASVVAGLVSVPVIAVPTDVGYGVTFKGVTALLAMLSSCANGISVVNIGNGFGAGVQADMINKLAQGNRL